MDALFRRRREENMTHILLTHGYFLSEDEKEPQIMKPYPPLGLLYLSAYLKTRGHSVEVYDSTFGTRPDLVQKAMAPDYALGAHTASLGLAFNTGADLPDSYRSGAFVGEHGSRNRPEFTVAP